MSIQTASLSSRFTNEFVQRWSVEPLKRFRFNFVTLTVLNVLRFNPLRLLRLLDASSLFGRYSLFQ